LAARETAALTVWVNSVPWIAQPEPGADHWGNYATERRELSDFVVANDIDNLVMLAGDAHMLAADDGSNNTFASDGIGPGFPVLHAAALDRRGSLKGGPYSEGAFPGGGQFGLLSITDDGGPEIAVAFSGRNWKGTELVRYSFTVGAGGADSAVEESLPDKAWRALAGLREGKSGSRGRLELPTSRL